MKGPRVLALLVGLAAALTLAACGVPPSGVIQAGDPASGISSRAPLPQISTDISVYFLHNVDLAAYTRKVPSPPDLMAALRLLFDGPTAGEAVTATTELPHLTAAPEVRIDRDNTFVIQLPAVATPFSHLAMRQLECTLSAFSAHPPVAGGASPATASLAGAQGLAAQMSVQVFGDGWTMEQSNSSCPAPLRP